METTNRVAIVTGASRGLGRVIAEVLAARGYRLVLSARTPRPLQAAADAFAATGAVAVAGDITDAAVRAQLVESARAFGGLDLLVNNASALGRIGPLLGFEPQHFGRLFPINAGAPLALIQVAVPLLEQRGGLIVNVTSDAARAAYAGWGPYGATKAALELLTRTLAVELKDRGVAAVIVDPGDMRTRMHQEAFPDEDISDRPLPEVTAPFWNWLLDQQPMDVSGGRFAAQAEDARWLLPV